MPRSIWATDSGGNFERSRRSSFGAGFRFVLSSLLFLTAFGLETGTFRFLPLALWLPTSFFCFGTNFSFATRSRLPLYLLIAQGRETVSTGWESINQVCDRTVPTGHQTQAVEPHE